MPFDGSSVGRRSKVPFALTVTTLHLPSHPCWAFPYAFECRYICPIGSNRSPYSENVQVPLVVLNGTRAPEASVQAYEDAWKRLKLWPSSWASTEPPFEPLYQALLPGWYARPAQVHVPVCGK